MTEAVAVRRLWRHQEAEQAALVLVARGIACRIEAEGRALLLLVAPEQAEQAAAELAAFERENRPASTDHQLGPAGWAAAWAVIALLLMVHGAQRRMLFGIDWTEIGAAQAGAILDGAWWRAATALTLHGDDAHLIGNLAAALAFGTILAQLLGPGLAWLAILLVGAGGNLINAWLHGPGHAAIGASTALFGALGLITGHRLHGWRIPWQGGIRRLAPLSAGILLLVFLGTGGERTDVGAHVLGFGLGVAAGFPLAVAPNLVHRPGTQRACGAVAVALLGLAWLLALRTL